MPSYADYQSMSATAIGQQQITDIKNGKKDNDIEIKVVASKAKVTSQRLPATFTDQFIKNPGLARSNLAVSVDKPNGDLEWRSRVKNYTTLQQHILFWDSDEDGQIFPWDVYNGFRQLGFNILFSIFAVLVININFSYPTRLAYSWFPDPWFRIYVHSVHKAKHGSDSGTYDPEGRFVPQQFENIFSKYDGDSDGALTLSELFKLMHGHRCAADPFGWGAAFFEWGSTWLLIQKEGKVFKEDLRGVYDGSLFWKIREQRQQKH
ncbi:putative peroxygenase 3 [Talaromyces islandicus]|uniref:Putative peroxygenase 3 n=1 Tax=Talaromyces islandicus TaxID=28573 RepID=A0A0U1LWI9_TALIS|nr:putative peroxygenase 3 [Talaromyces islandicus]